MNKDINHYGNETIIDDARYEWEQETGMFTGGSGREGGHEDMDGDYDSAMASAGHGTDEDYGYYGETSGNQMRKYADIISESSKKKEKVTATRMPMQAPFKVVKGHTGKRKKRS